VRDDADLQTGGALRVKDGKALYINAAMLFSFLIVTATGFLQWVFKPWGNGEMWADILTAGCRLFGILHRWSGLIFVILAFYHIHCHWSWIVEMLEKLRKEHLYGNTVGMEPDSLKSDSER
jgi:hypothetical protein